jgi:hypothetical protein
MAILVCSCGSEEWIPLFDGKTLEGWKASENADSWIIEDGAIVTNGPRSHLFYEGEAMNHEFKNFEFTAEVKTEPASNSGIYFHTEFQDEGWPEKGYECQVINSKPDAEPGRYVENKMTGSIYAIRNTWKSPVPDREWFQYRIVVQGKTIQTYIDGGLIAEYTEPANPYRPDNLKGRLLSSGTFALQCHDPGSRVHFRNLKVKSLPDDLPTPGSPPDDLEFEKQIIDLASNNIPLADLHVHLKGGLTMEDALAHARRYGYSYGFAVNCGKDMTLETDEEMEEYLDGFNQPPQTWHAMQAEGREWMEMFSPDVVARFDYVFTDAMTWTNNEGRRMRLWIPEETVVGDPQDFMIQLVDRIVTLLESEPIDIYVNPTYLPDTINGMYDQLWTEERMDRVIRALVENKVALEINNRRMIPSPAFIRCAKKAGVKFTFGTNNAGADDLGRMEYAIRMISECGLGPDDIWLPDKN